MTNHPNRSKRMEGWYWCRLRENNPWTICRWSGSHWYAADYALECPPQVIDSECLHEPIADDDPGLLAAGERAVTMVTAYHDAITEIEDRVHAVAVKHGIVLPEPVVRDMASYLHGNECGRGWLIERYINDKLHFWNAGALGHGRRDGFTDLIDDAVRFARQEDASTVLFHVCDGQGRVAEHVWFMGAGAS